MGKSVRAKKAKKADFQKVKMKVGRKLKQAANETRTDFKARKVILKEQLKLKSTAELVTKNKHDIKELISRLNYHNVYVRQDGINGLREIVLRYEPTLLMPHMANIIKAAAPTILDADPLIRSSSAKFMEALIMKMGPSIEPYFKILVTHLSCAMVHLNIAVQGDSIKLMKVLIKHTPSLVAKDANLILNNFLQLIFRKTKQHQLKETNGTPEPKGFNFGMLLQAPQERNPFSTHSGRLELITQLSNFLEAILKEQERYEEELPHNTWEAVVAGSIPPLACDNSALKKENDLWLFSNPKKLEHFAHMIVRLLMLLWVEVDTLKSEDTSAGGNALNENGVETLECVVNIMLLVWKITQICTQDNPKQTMSIKKQFREGFVKKVIKGFPYCCQVSLEKKKKKQKSHKKENIEDSMKNKLKHCDDLNVKIAIFGTEMAIYGHRERANNYLSMLLRDGNRDGQYSMNTVITTIKELIPYSTTSEIETIVNSAHTCYCRLHPLKKERPLLLELLLEATDINHEEMWQNKYVNLWIADIVKDLTTGDVRAPLLQSTIYLRLRGNTDINSLLLSEKNRISESIKAKGVQGLTLPQIEEQLEFLLKD